MKKPVMLAVAGVGGVAVALVLYMFVLGGHSSAQPAVEATPVATGGRLGPHITLAQRVFNLQSSSSAPVYLKLQTVIEFETTSAVWARVLRGCVAVLPASVPDGALVSAMPGGTPPRAVAPPQGGPAVNPCVAEEQRLLEEFDHEIGTGRQLIEDAVTTIVTRHTPADIATPQGKEALKAEIKEAVEHLIPEPPVVRVLFTDFITQ